MKKLVLTVDGITYERITKAEARRRIKARYEAFITPSKLTMLTPTLIPITVDFEQFILDFKIQKCGNYSCGVPVFLRRK